MATSGTTISSAPVYGVVYRVTNTTNGHCYVGQTKTKLAARWSKHKGDARKGAGWVLADALRKHGAEAFVLDVLQQCSTRDDLNDAKIAWIARLAPEYNATAGGGGLGAPIQSVRDKISAATKGKPKSPQARANIAAGLIGRTVSETTRGKLREQFKGRDLRGPRSVAEREALAERNRARRKHPVRTDLLALYAAVGATTRSEKISAAARQRFARSPV